MDAEYSKLLDDFFESIDMAGSYMKFVNMLIASYIDRYKDEGMPMADEFADVMHEFINKYIGFDVLKDQLKQLYCDFFLYEEMCKIVDFYKSEVGTKLFKMQPDIMKRCMNIGHVAFMENEDEFENMLYCKMKKLGE